MPELPEVETMCRGIAAAAGCRIDDVHCPNTGLRPIIIRPSLAALRKRLAGRRIEAVVRVGKRVVLQLDTAERLVLEPRMTGRVLLADPPNASHLRLAIRLSGGTVDQILFWDVRGLGVVTLLTADEFARRLGPEQLGPDALTIPAAELRDRLGASRRAIKVALMDQRAVVGIGNLYASEILHRAKIHPTTPCNRLRPAAWQRIHLHTQEVLAEAIACQGSTLSDGTYRNVQGESGGFQEHHRVYQRAGERCLQCARGVIQRIVQAQRSTFFCPRCQRP
jgi:formamidopyrimidine-DNA glycosylase